MDTKQHYENHLAEYYSWMFGDFESKLNESENFFLIHNIITFSNKTALDLGAGSGLQSIPLAKFGFNVIAVDFSKKILDELNSLKGDLNIKTIEADIMDFEKYSKQAELIVCMGDTLTHLTSHDDVNSLLKNCFKLLALHGKIIISYRDLSSELTGGNRFIPVKSTDDLIFTCFLEYEKDSVNVHDIIHKKINGKWEQKVSSYKKLRLAQQQLIKYLELIGFKISYSDNLKGFVTIIAEVKK